MDTLESQEDTNARDSPLTSSAIGDHSDTVALAVLLEV
jgi:hypothetical protein